MQTFKKPKNVRYTDMCIYIDDLLKRDTELSEQEQEKVFKYLYLIIYMLAKHEDYFNREYYYDEFSLILASDVYHRLFLNPKLETLDETTGHPTMVKIKSCLNYIKSILYPRKVAFEQKYYSQKVTSIEDISNSENVAYSTYSYIKDDIYYDTQFNLGIYFEEVSRAVKRYIYKTSPYRKNRLLIKNIYISCILSIMNAITFMASDLDTIENKYKSENAKFIKTCNVYSDYKNNCVILYHLSDDLYDYIKVLVRQLFTVIGNDIKEICNDKQSISENIIMNMAISEMFGDNYYDN